MHRTPLIRGAACVAVGVLAVVLLISVAPALLMLSPAIALLVLVALGLFPSAELISALRRRLHRPRVALPQFTTPACVVGWLRPGQLIAFGLAVRPPPVRGFALA